MASIDARGRASSVARGVRWFERGVVVRAVVARERGVVRGDDDVRGEIERGGARGRERHAARALDGMRLDSEDFAAFTQATKAYRDESMRRDASAGGSHAGMAGATINALGSRLLFDMFRDERWQREQTEKLVNKLNNAPGTPVRWCV